MLDPERTLVTPRLRLEPLLPKHAPELFQPLQDKRLYSFYAGEPPATMHALKKRYAAWATRQSPDGTQTWLNYAVRRKDDVYVGWVQATISGDTATIGYDIFPDFWRQGYGKEACSELVRLLCAAKLINKVVAVVDTENVASIRLLERLGFAIAWTGSSEDLPGRRDHRYERRCRD